MTKFPSPSSSRLGAERPRRRDGDDSARRSETKKSPSQSVSHSSRSRSRDLERVFSPRREARGISSALASDNSVDTRSKRKQRQCPFSKANLNLFSSVLLDTSLFVLRKRTSESEKRHCLLPLTVRLSCRSIRDTRANDIVGGVDREFSDFHGFAFRSDPLSRRERIQAPLTTSAEQTETKELLFVTSHSIRIVSWENEPAQNVCQRFPSPVRPVFVVRIDCELFLPFWRTASGSIDVKARKRIEQLYELTDEIISAYNEINDKYVNQIYRKYENMKELNRQLQRQLTSHHCAGCKCTDRLHDEDGSDNSVEQNGGRPRSSTRTKKTNRS